MPAVAVMPVWVWIVAAAVAHVVSVLTDVLEVRHRRKKAKQAADDDDWDWEPADLGADKQGKSTAMAADATTQVIATAGAQTAAPGSET